MYSPINKVLTVKELAFLCKYKLHSKLLESTIRSYLYKNIKNNLLKAEYKKGQYLIKKYDFEEFLCKYYSQFGFSYNPI